MDKYIGNKKSIVEDLEQFMVKKNISNGIFFDAFTGTTNVAQYFKQRGFDIILCDTNSFSKVLGETYVVNNSFPTFKGILSKIEDKIFFDIAQLNEMIEKVIQKIVTDKIFLMNYLEVSDFTKNIIPLAKVIYYLNNLDNIINFEDENFFLEYYTIYGNKSMYKSLRGSVGKRNYFSEYNAKKLGIILEKIKFWRSKNFITEMEVNILLTSVIEEVTLIANVAGTFHDFNRNKLYPNALVKMQLKIPILNITQNNGRYIAFKEDTNLLYKNNDYNKFISGKKKIELLYIDPPYNFRQYSDYYHLLNFIAEYPYTKNLKEYGNGLEYVRGQNMRNSFKSQYSYKETFENSLTELISNTCCKNVIVSYYDENNHWTHGKEINYEGRKAIISSIKNSKGITQVDEEPYSVKRQNYQSRKGENKKIIDELFFYGRK